MLSDSDRIFEGARLELQGASRAYDRLVGRRNATAKDRARAKERLVRARIDFKCITGQEPDDWEW